MPKLCEMRGVRGGEEGFPVELWQDDDTGRLAVRAYNEAGYNSAEIDFDDLCRWLNGPEAAPYRNVSAQLHHGGNQGGA
jgi:hypothetical protein